MGIKDVFIPLLSDYTVKEESYGISFKKIIAERKVFLSTKKLEYSGKLKIEDEKKEVVFSDMLKESGTGLSSITNNDYGPGIGFSTTTYSSGVKGRVGMITEQSELFKKKYSYNFKFEELREKLEKACKEEGYSFKYSIF